jgi:hypothetical protein
VGIGNKKMVKKNIVDAFMSQEGAQAPVVPVDESKFPTVSRGVLTGAVFSELAIDLHSNIHTSHL